MPTNKEKKGQTSALLILKLIPCNFLFCLASGGSFLVQICHWEDKIDGDALLAASSSCEVVKRTMSMGICSTVWQLWFILETMFSNFQCLLEFLYQDRWKSMFCVRSHLICLFFTNTNFPKYSMEHK